MAAIPQQFLGFSYKHLATAATTVVKALPGRLQAVVVNAPGTTSSVSVYDGLTAGGALIAAVSGFTAPTRLQFEVQCKVGITVVIAGSPAPDVTILFQ